MPSQPCSLLLHSLTTSLHVIELFYILYFMCQICGIGILSRKISYTNYTACTRVWTGLPAVQLMWVLISRSVHHYSNSRKMQYSYWVSNSNHVLQGVLCSLHAYHITLQLWLTSALYSEVLKVFVQTGTTLAYS